MDLGLLAIANLALTIFLAVAVAVLLLRRPQGGDAGNRLAVFESSLERMTPALQDGLARNRTEAAQTAQALRDEVNAQFERFASLLLKTLESSAQRHKEQIDGLTQLLSQRLGEFALKIRELTEDNVKRQDALKETVEKRLDILRAENEQKLEQMRATVDEKLQTTLEARLGASFTQVNENLKLVFNSVGEMKSLAEGVGDLKKVLTNVKTRGTWGEVSLQGLLDLVLSPEQYAANVEVKPGSGQRVEFAVRLPGQDDDGTPVWLPMDAKFPMEDYERLVEAAERADAEAVEAAAQQLELRIRKSAKDIAEKYVHPPHSTDFGIMFLPTEGLYAEVTRRPGLVDALQREFRVVVAGPTTLHAILSSLRMGFRSLAIQKRSSEVWKVLGSVKTEFGRFGQMLDKVQKKLTEAQNAVEEGHTRRRVMDRRLKEVETLPETAPDLLLAQIAAAEFADDAPEEDEDA